MAGRPPVDIEGKRYGRIVALHPVSPRKRHSTCLWWRCQCDCGKVVDKPLSTIRKAKYCGHRCGMMRVDGLNLPRYPERDREMLRLYREGRTPRSLARQFQITRQRVHQIIQREGANGQSHQSLSS